jgi:hypothetical protein
MHPRGQQHRAHDRTWRTANPSRDMLPSGAVARYEACETFDDAEHPALTHWQRTSALIPQRATWTCRSKFCTLAEDLYLTDRCWNKRAVCALTAGAAANRPLIVGQADASPAGTQLRPGGYAVALGPAAALGVGARKGFADRLRDHFEQPVVSLGRGGAGPTDYLRALDEEPGLLPLLARAAAVAVVTMAGRSSSNSRFGPEVSAMARAAAMTNLSLADPPLGARLRNESLDTAAREYAELARRIRAHAAAARAPPPVLLLIWFSECELRTGCDHFNSFPQFYTDPQRVQSLAKRIGARTRAAPRAPPLPPPPPPHRVLALRVCSRARRAKSVLTHPAPPSQASSTDRTAGPSTSSHPTACPSPNAAPAHPRASAPTSRAR